MDEYESLSHTKWDCKYHIIFVPKCRRRTVYSYCAIQRGQIRTRDLHLAIVFE
jgi:putative transposase